MPDLSAFPTVVETWLMPLDPQGKSRHTQVAYRWALAHVDQWVVQLYGLP